MQSKIRKENFAAIVSAAILYCLIPPYFFWNTVFSSIYAVSFFASILAAIFFFFSGKWEGRDKGLFVLFLLSLIIFTFSGGYNLNFLIGLLPSVFLPFAKDEFSKNVYQWFLRIYVVIIAVSLVSWVLVLLGIMPSFGVIAPLNTRKAYSYSVYPLLVTYSDFSNVRFFGPFDEPGVVGTLSGIFLCIEKFDLKNRKAVVLLMSGLCSLSFFFFILMGVYFMVYYTMRKKSVSGTVLIILVVLLAGYAINHIPILHDKLGARFEWDSSQGQFAGDNRINFQIVKDNFDEIFGTSQFWWGINNKDLFLDAVAGSSSIFTIVIVHGMVFIIIYFLFYVLYGLRYKKSVWMYLLYLFVVIGTLYQRPWMFTTYYVFLFTYLARFGDEENVCC